MTKTGSQTKPVNRSRKTGLYTYDVIITDQNIAISKKYKLVINLTTK